MTAIQLAHWLNCLFLFQEFADYFVRQLKSKKDGKHKMHTNATYTTDVDPFAEIIWHNATRRDIPRACKSEKTGTRQAQEHFGKKISAGATSITLLVPSFFAREEIFVE